MALIFFVTLLNGAAEEVFFRGALFAAIGRRYPHHHLGDHLRAGHHRHRQPDVGLRRPDHGLCVFGLQRRASGGILASMITHLVWSVVMLLALPPIINK